jgi:hypothetical protein
MFTRHNATMPIHQSISTLLLLLSIRNVPVSTAFSSLPGIATPRIRRGALSFLRQPHYFVRPYSSGCFSAASGSPSCHSLDVETDTAQSREKYTFPLLSGIRDVVNDYDHFILGKRACLL